jgi:hypothetical protein
VNTKVLASTQHHRSIAHHSLLVDYFTFSNRDFGKISPLFTLSPLFLSLHSSGGAFFLSLIIQNT